MREPADDEGSATTASATANWHDKGCIQLPLEVANSESLHRCLMYARFFEPFPHVQPWQSVGVFMPCKYVPKTTSGICWWWWLTFMNTWMPCVPGPCSLLHCQCRACKRERFSRLQPKSGQRYQRHTDHWPTSLHGRCPRTFDTYFSLNDFQGSTHNSHTHRVTNPAPIEHWLERLS